MEEVKHKTGSNTIFSYIVLAIYLLVGFIIISLVVFDIFDTFPLVIVILLIHLLYVISTLIRVRLIRKKQLRKGNKPIDLSNYEEVGNSRQLAFLKKIANALENYKSQRYIIKMLLSEGVNLETATELIKQISINPQLIKNRMSLGVKYIGICSLILSISIPAVYYGRRAALFDGLQYAVAIFYFFLGLSYYFAGKFMYRSIMNQNN